MDMDISHQMGSTGKYMLNGKLIKLRWKVHAGNSPSYSLLMLAEDFQQN